MGGHVSLEILRGTTYIDCSALANFPDRRIKLKVHAYRQFNIIIEGVVAWPTYADPIIFYLNI